MDKSLVASSIGESCPMEVDSPSPETVVSYGKKLRDANLLPVLKSNEFSHWTASCRSPSLPSLTGRNVVVKDMQTFNHQASADVSLNRSISYEQCYLAENCEVQSNPIVKLCKLEHKLQYYSPTRWKRTLVVETMIYNQQPVSSTGSNQATRSPRSLSNHEEEKKMTGSKLRNIIYPGIARPTSSDDNITNNTFFTILFFIAIPALLLFSSTVILYGSVFGSSRCEGHLDLENIELTLSREIVGQNLALVSFLDALKEIFLLNDGENNSTMSVIMFIGGTGVGKSYITSLTNELYPTHWVQIYLNAQVDLIRKESQDKALDEIANKLSICGTNLVMIDDATDFIRSHPIENRVNFMEQLYYTAQNSSKKILLMVMLNDGKGNHFWDKKMQLSQRVDDTINFLRGLGDVQTYTIQFTPLNRGHIVKCIRKSLEKEGISVLDEEISELLDRESVENFPNGCKGIYKYVHELSINTFRKF